MDKEFRRRALALSGDIIFCEVMRDERICKLFLERLLGIQIREIVYINKQQDLSPDVLERGVRLDVYVEDDNGNRYDIEMQCSTARDLGLRVRYIQHEIDHRILEKGDDYDNMSGSYVIFVCDFDPFGRGRAQYTFRTQETKEPALALEDGRTVIFLNARYERGDADREILEFLDRVRDGGYEVKGGTLSRMAVERAQEVRGDERTVQDVMRLATRLQDEWRCGYGLGREEGIELGIVQGREEGIGLGIAQGREEGIGLGIVQGREEGIGQGVHAMISLLRDMGFGDAAICERLMQKFHFTYECAAAAVAEYDNG